MFDTVHLTFIFFDCLYIKSILSERLLQIYSHFLTDVESVLNFSLPYPNLSPFPVRPFSLFWTCFQNTVLSWLTETYLLSPVSRPRITSSSSYVSLLRPFALLFYCIQECPIQSLNPKIELTLSFVQELYDLSDKPDDTTLAQQRYLIIIFVPLVKFPAPSWGSFSTLR